MLKFVWLGLISLLLASCGGGANHAENTLEEAKNITLPAAPDERGKATKLMWDNYLKLNTALVEGNNTSANQWSVALSQAIGTFPTDSLTEEERMRWQHQGTNLQKQIQALSSADVEVQRTGFEDLSKSMYQLITEWGLPKGTTVYQQLCPMAFDNRGAWWLSDKAEILNPYFGDKMLTCGTVTEAIQFN